MIGRRSLVSAAGFGSMLGLVSENHAAATAGPGAGPGRLLFDLTVPLEGSRRAWVLILERLGQAHLLTHEKFPLSRT